MVYFNLQNYVLEKQINFKNIKSETFFGEWLEREGKSSGK